MAERIDPRRAKLPPPSPELFEAMARAGINAADQFIRSMHSEVKGTMIAESEWMPIWFSAAHDMYGVLAKHAGARVEVLKGGLDE